MARPKSFNEAKVLSDMMLVFWQQGYEATAMRDLEKASGLSAGSIYHEFGSKKQLFLRCLKFYLQTVIDTRIATFLEQSEDPLAGIQTYLITAFKDVPKPYRDHACLLTNSAMELGQSDDDIAKVVQFGLNRIERAFARAIERAQAQGTLKPTLNPALTAKNISLILSGLMIQVRAGTKSKLLEEVVIQHLSTLTA